MDNPLKNLFAITDLRNRVLFTLAMLGVYRIGNHVPTPGVNTEALNVMAATTKGTGPRKKEVPELIKPSND